MNVHSTFPAVADAQPAPAKQIGTILDRKVAVQMAAYPDHWTAAEKREMAEQHLFGREAARG